MQSKTAIFARKCLPWIRSSSTRRPISPNCVAYSSWIDPRNWNYEEEKKNFTLTAPQYYNFARDVVDSWAEKEKAGLRGSVPAFWWLNESGQELKWSFQDISYQSKLVANVLTGPCKLKANDVVIVILPRVPQWWVLNVAAIRAGVILSPGTTLLRPSDIQYRLNAANAKCVITNPQCADLVDEVANACPSLETKVIVGENETSGTTGAPKMTEHTHASYGLGHLLTAKYFLGLAPSDILWNLSDTGWAKCAWSSLFSPWIAGACVFAQDVAKFDPQDTLKNPELLEEWEDGTGLKLYEGYGQTETTFLCGTYPSIEQRPGSMGKPSPGIEIQVVDDSGIVVPRGKEGNIGILYKPHRPVGLFSRYIDDDDRMKSVFVGDYYLTGDRAVMDEDGYVWFVGRADDVILSSGYRIGPFEVESALIEHPAVLESAVVSSPDQLRGEVVKAFVTLTDSYKFADQDALVQELQDHAKTVTAPYKYPRKIEFVDMLPKTVSGKIRRVELRNKEWGRETKD